MLLQEKERCVDSCLNLSFLWNHFETLLLFVSWDVLLLSNSREGLLQLSSNCVMQKVLLQIHKTDLCL